MKCGFDFIDMESNEYHEFEIDFESEITVADQLLQQGFVLNCQGNILVVQQRSVQGLLASELISKEEYTSITFRIFNKMTRFITTFESFLPKILIAKPFSEENFKKLAERIGRMNGRGIQDEI